MSPSRSRAQTRRSWAGGSADSVDLASTTHRVRAVLGDLDSSIAVTAAALVLLGVVMSYSTTAPLALEHPIPPLFARHVVALFLGIGVAAAAAGMPLVVIHRLALPLWAVGTLLLLATALFGVEVNGAQRWLGIPGIHLRFQPVEVAKLATVLAVASVIAKRDTRQELNNRQTTIAALLTLPVVALLLFQPDLGNAALICGLVGLLLVVAGMPARRLVLPTIVGSIGVAGFILLNPYAMRRVTSFLDPWAQAHDAGFQLVQSFVAFGHGGLWGAGLGNGRQKLFFLPEAHTDFILALVAEELGLIGVLVVLCAFAVIAMAGLRVASRARSRFALLVAVGMTALLTVPAAVNSAVVMGLLPTKGLTLPFLSYGRTSLIVCFAALGLILGVARNSTRPLRGERAASVAGGGRWR